MNTSKTANRSSVSNGSRKQCIFCSLASTFLCLGVVFLVAGIVIYILTTTSSSSSNYLNDLFYYRSNNPENKFQTPIIVAIVLVSVSAFFIFLAIIFAVFACVSNDDCCPSKRSSHDYEAKVSFENGQKHHTEEEKLLSPIIDSKDTRTVSVNTTPKMLVHGMPSPTSTSPNPQIHGDINAIGLPLTNSGRHRVPPNGFSYLSNPSEIQSYHENRHTPSRNQQAIRMCSIDGVATKSILKKESAI